MQVAQRQAPTKRLALLFWGTVVVAAIALGLLAEPPQFAGVVGRGRMLPRMPGPPSDLPTLLYQFGVGSLLWYAAALALPILPWGARRIDSERLGRGRVLAISLGAVLLLVTMKAIVQYVLTYRGSPGPGVPAYLPFALRQNLLPWIALAGIVAAVEARRRSVQSRVERERLRAQVAEQRLVALTGQLHPHFLFNTLQGISTLIHRDPEAADEMLGKLSELPTGCTAAP